MAGYYYVGMTPHDEIPSSAVIGGHDNGNTIYAGRALHNGELLPAKVLPSVKVAYVSYNGVEYGKDKFELLCEKRMEWIASSHGRVPDGVVECGRASNGEHLYIGRCQHNGTLTVGKVYPSHRCLYIPYDGQEVRYDHYEILIMV